MCMSVDQDLCLFAACGPPHADVGELLVPGQPHDHALLVGQLAPRGPSALPLHPQPRVHPADEWKRPHGR